MFDLNPDQLPKLWPFTISSASASAIFDTVSEIKVSIYIPVCEKQEWTSFNESYVADPWEWKNPDKGSGMEKFRSGINILELQHWTTPTCKRSCHYKIFLSKYFLSRSVPFYLGTIICGVFIRASIIRRLRSRIPASDFMYEYSVWRIRDVYPGSWFLPIPDPGSGISDPGSKNSNKREKWKKICYHTVFCSHKVHKTEYYVIFEMLKNKIWANFQRIVEVFTQKIFNMLSTIWVWDPGSEIRDPEKTYFGSRIQGSKRHRIPDPDPQHW